MILLLVLDLRRNSQKAGVLLCMNIFPLLALLEFEKVLLTHGRVYKTTVLVNYKIINLKRTRKNYYELDLGHKFIYILI